ncbi:MAG: T9SS type A sorting domain-containing protein [Bacteroidetes bacterium]|nr:T9SS type A sorting domain-containing protein [Bacteroidota bacterium]
MKTFISIILSIFTCTQLYSQAGELDLSFGGDGFIITELGESFDGITSMAIQEDGKIVAVGYSYGATHSNFGIARYNIDGSLDNTFSLDGKLVFDFDTTFSIPYSVVVQADNKIVVGGYATLNDTSIADCFALARLNADGSLDDGFGDGGIIKLYIGTTHLDIIYSLQIQPDGKILAAGTSYSDHHGRFVVTRFNSDGTLDNSFSDIDESFGDDGIVVISIGTDFDLITSVIIQPDNKIIASGYSSDFDSDTDISIARFNPDGSLDYSFSGDGTLRTDIAEDDHSWQSLIQPDGKIITAGQSKQDGFAKMAIVRYNPDGSMDTTFGIEGIIELEIDTLQSIASSIILGPDGKLLVGGSAGTDPDNDFCLVKILTDIEVGILDFNQANQFIIYPNPTTEYVKLSFTLKQSENISLSLINIDGSLVKNYRQNVSYNPGICNEFLHLPSEIASGIYYLLIETENAKVSIAINIQH